jgi:glycosyltransferase involved in cell wall biosynthesis
MKIAMFTNTYLPHVGGVANSVERFTEGCREGGHDVLVVAPSYPDQKESTEQTYRLPAMPNLNGSDFSVPLPMDNELSDRLEQFAPDVIHAHHPFLVGNTAARAAAKFNVPLLFTHHTMYEHYTHYVPVELDVMKRYVQSLATGYANLCDRVIAPSESTAEIIRDRGVESPISVVPTGVDVEDYAEGDAEAFRRQWSIDADCPLVGHVGRLAEEKNIPFLTRACGEAMRRLPELRFCVVGDGDSRDDMRTILGEMDLLDRTIFAGVLKGKDLIDAYHAMDVFAFASVTETQGMVLTEACAAGCPVVALDAPGAREVVRDGQNGRLVDQQDTDALAQAIVDVATAGPEARSRMVDRARNTAGEFSSQASLDKLLEVYRDTLNTIPKAKDIDGDEWQKLHDRIREEWRIWSNRLQSAVNAMGSEQKSESGKPEK